ncbi:MAG: hypothetical protein ACTTJG_06610 [Treponema sp.]
MIITDTNYPKPFFKPVEELCFTDDYMFGTIMKNENICRGVLERLLHMKIGKIEYPTLQKSISPFYESKGIRLDVYTTYLISPFWDGHFLYLTYLQKLF